MKKLKWSFCIAAFTTLCTLQTHAQNVGINEDGSAPNANAILDIKSNSKGILIPRVSTTARLAIPNINGMLVYDTTARSFWYNNGTSWQNLATGNPGAGTGWALTGNDNVNDTVDFIGTTGPSLLKIRANNVLSGMIDPTVGINNTYWGFNTGRLIHRDTAFANTGIGGFSQSSNVFGSENSSLGFSSLSGNTTGIGNTAVGADALLSNGTGMHNTALGISSLQNARNGLDVTGLGAFTDVSPTGSSTLTNATAIGALALVNASNKVRIGNNAVTVVEGAAPYTTLSDGRFKFEVQEDVKGLDFILHLRPVTYRFDAQKFDTHQRQGLTQDKKAIQANAAMQSAYTQASAIRRSGFIAQEVEQAASVSGYDFSGVIRPQSEQDHYSLSYESFVVPLVKAIQEQQKIIEALKKEVDELKQHSK